MNPSGKRDYSDHIANPFNPLLLGRVCNFFCRIDGFSADNYRLQLSFNLFGALCLFFSLRSLRGKKQRMRCESSMEENRSL
jgi:hypothetical protein